VIVLALAGGTVMLSVVLAVLRASAGPDSEAAGMLTLLVPCLAVANVTVYFVLRRALLAKAREQREAARTALRAGNLPPELFRLTLIGCALAESVGLFGAVVYFLGGSMLLLLAPALAVIAILAQWPGSERSESQLLG
jgi:F0F1-type ATP synthase membrane subunit c/vacuolar-type H+-ATPase subunit K